MKEKGIEDAILAVRKCNETLERKAFRLDIYGLVQQEQWFEQLIRSALYFFGNGSNVSRLIFFAAKSMVIL